MQTNLSESGELATRLMEAVMPLMKDRQAEIMAVTADFDLTLSQGRILFELGLAGEDLAVNDLATRISLSIAATTRAIDALFRSGLLSRREDDIDRRVKRIGLTSRGHEIIGKILRAKRQTVERFVARLTDDERTALEAAVATIGALTSAYFPATRDLCDAAPSREPSP
jgi:DNA-binding MarR family transcriptional regulator